MTCPSCPLIVKTDLEQGPSVERAEVTIEPPRAVIRLANPTLAPETLVAAVREAGYGAAVLRETDKVGGR